MAPLVRASVAPADLTMEDSAWPFPAGQAPPADCTLVYGPGDTPHTWTPGEVTEQTTRYRLPGFVQSNPGGASYIQDANAFTAWLKQIGAPVGCATFLDLEMAVSPGYVSAFGHIMNLEGYKVLPYGSVATVWQNPHLDGLFTAHYTEAPHLCSPSACGFGLNATAVISQYQNTPAYDLSLIDLSVPLWDTQPAPPPSPPTNLLEENVTSYYVNNQHHVYAQRPDGSVDHWWQALGSTQWNHEKLLPQ